MKNTSWVWKEIRREKSAKIVLLAISFSFLVTILMFIVSGTFIKNVQKQTEDIYGYFDHILYHAEQNTDNLSFSQKKISKKYQPYVKRIGTITLFDYEENQKNIGRQLNGVSKAIQSMAKDLEKDLEVEEKYENQKTEIIELLRQKEIEVQDLVIKKDTIQKKNNISKYILHISTNFDDKRIKIEIYRTEIMIKI